MEIDIFTFLLGTIGQPFVRCGKRRVKRITFSKEQSTSDCKKKGTKAAKKPLIPRAAEIFCPAERGICAHHNLK